MFQRLIFFLLFVSFMVLSACANFRSAHRAPRVETAKPAEHRTSSLEAMPAYPPTTRPARLASYGLVDKGRESLILREYLKSVDIFHEAINVDPSNGVAYFFMAFAKSSLQGGDPEALEEINNLLDRSESLLINEFDWQDEILKLRLQISPLN